MKQLISLVGLLCFCVAANAQYRAEVSARYGRLDTGPSTATITAPEVAVFRVFGNRSEHLIGIAYSKYDWEDRKSRVWTPPPGADIPYRMDTDGDAQWDLLTLRYDYTLPISKVLSLRIGPGVGVARNSESVTITTYGGIAGIERHHRSLSTDARLAVEARAVLVFQLGSRWDASAGVSAIRIDSPGGQHIVAGSLSGAQGVVSLGFAF